MEGVADAGPLTAPSLAELSRCLASSRAVATTPSNSFKSRTDGDAVAAGTSCLEGGEMLSSAAGASDVFISDPSPMLKLI